MIEDQEDRECNARATEWKTLAAR